MKKKLPESTWCSKEGESFTKKWKASPKSNFKESYDEAFYIKKKRLKNQRNPLTLEIIKGSEIMWLIKTISHKKNT